MRSRVILSALAVTAAACTDAVSPSATASVAPSTNVTSLSLEIRGQSVGAGDTVRFNVRARDGQRLVADAPITWSTDDTTVAIVEDGLAIGLRAGSAHVYATSGTASTFGAVYVGATSAVPERLTVAPDSIRLAADSAAQLDATLRFSNEVRVKLRTSVAWRALDTTVATVTAGRVTARRAGRTLVTATLLGLADTTVVNVGTAAAAPPSTEPAPLPSGAKQHFVAPNGSRTGDGTAERPWDLRTALEQPGKIVPGDTVWVRGGRYEGYYRSSIAGTASAPIVVRQLRGERATIDGRLDVGGSHTIFWGLEVTSSDPNRVSAQAGGEPTDLPRHSTALAVTGSYIKLVNMIAHDLGQGVFGNMAAVGLEMSGNLIYNNGWRGADRGHGHNLYLQNDGPTKNILDNVMFGSFAIGLHIYGSDAAVLRNFRIEGNTIFESGAPLSDFPGSPGWNLLHYGGNNFGATVYRGNSLFHRYGTTETVKIGAPGTPPGSDIEFRDNTVHGMSVFNDVRRYTVTGNRFTSGRTPIRGQSALLVFRPVPGEPLTSNVWNSNRYAVPSGGDQLPFATTGPLEGNYWFPGWQSATGYDRSSSIVAQFSGADVIVRPSAYERGRAFVTVWNWDRAGTVPVNLGDVLSPGDAYEIHHVYDVFGAPVVTGTYTGGTVMLPQPAIAPPVPTGYRAYGSPTPEFAVFLVRKR